ncbi:Membrane protein insertase YidC [wastewater metagenome]|uniref:Membrane protein insertase YidC n=2 Tax=unclassified sequences TaxID=12908 RepID=A0A5B8R967_9ZZZZ|nr:MULTISPECIES: membrane protein insertase YidC [Arhodomonas]MCS4504956.1 membrane protein insertase YidC [Arhodomonas aquaeolei]QEA05081.1 membrane protein insertase YidC [uncultured organism]
MENVRLFLFAALGALLLLLWNAWQQENAPQQPQPTATASGEQQASSPSGARPAGAAGSEQASTGGGTGDEVPADSPRTADSGDGADTAGQTVRVLTDLLDVRIDTAGGRVVSAALRKHSVTQGGDQPFPVLKPEDPYFVAEAGLIGDDAPAPGRDARWQVGRTEYRLAEGDDRIVVPMTWTGPNGVSVTRRFVFSRDSYVVDVEQAVDNGGDAPYRAYQYVQLRRDRPENGSSFLGGRSYTGAAFFTPENRYQKYGFDDMDEKPLSQEVTNGWVSFVQHYFLAAWVPSRDVTERFYSRVHNNRYAIGMSSPWQTVAPGESTTFSSRLFVGPKDQDRLAAVADGLELTVDYGWLTILSKPLFIALSWIHGVIGNWGWAIIILTLGIKAAFYKLSETSYRSMARMRKLQPRMQQLKERFGDDRQGMNQELMKLYKEEKVNPLGGCLPIVIQIPVFIALYWVLLGSVELRHAPWILWIHDLSAPDPYYIMPLIMGATMLLQQRLNPAPMDPVQKRVMSFLPVVFTVFFVFFPAGLVLYWVTNNSLSILQQWLITRRIEAADGQSRGG